MDRHWRANYEISAADPIRFAGARRVFHASAAFLRATEYLLA
jgi:hypothetical protein